MGKRLRRLPALLAAGALATPLTAYGEAADQEAGPASNEASSGYEALTGDAAAGRRIFARCMACHTVSEGQNRVGPSLYQIVGRQAGSVDGFRYSQANLNADYVWTEETLFAYLEDPRAFMPGTTMIFAGLPKAQDRADLIAYLKSTSP